MSKRTSKKGSDRVRGDESSLGSEKGRLEIQFIRVEGVDLQTASEAISADELLKQLDQIHAQTPVRGRKRANQSTKQVPEE